MIAGASRENGVTRTRMNTPTKLTATLLAVALAAAAITSSGASSAVVESAQIIFIAALPPALLLGLVSLQQAGAQEE